MIGLLLFVDLRTRTASIGGSFLMLTGQLTEQSLLGRCGGCS
jgi:hypothetical protein